ncbi:MAG: dockerin type I domain-containing protein [Candidatus Zixiibacteriota bacterium]
MRKMIVCFLFLALLLASCPLASAFRLIRYDPNETSGFRTEPHWWPIHDTLGQEWHNFAHWDLREFPQCRIPWSAHDGTGDLPGLTEFDEVNSGFNSWEAVAPAVIGFRREAAAGAQPPLNLDNNNMIGWGAGLPANVLGITAIWRVMSSGQILESDVLFNDVDWWWKIGPHNIANDTADVQSIAVHEIGHVIGVHHSEINGAAAVCPTMWWAVNPFDGTIHQRSLEQDDRRACNFLYTPDIGDAPDPDCGGFNLYPSLVHRPGAGRTLNGVQLDSWALGAEHIFGTKGQSDPDDDYLYEWLGDDVSGECESNQTNADPRDDGVSITVDPINMIMQFEVTVSTGIDDAGNFHDYSDHHLYLNIWVDWNCDCDWDAPNEHVVGPGEIVDPPAPGVTQVYTYVVGMPYCGCDSLWVRVRLDWGEDCWVVENIDGTLLFQYGAAQFGEVEDYVVLCPGWRWKFPYDDYAPSGMPDFSQLQDNWMNPSTGQMTFCGPVAIANCWWWFDSKYNEPVGVPGDGVDMFPLVRDYMDDLTSFLGLDDHDMWNVDHSMTPWPPQGPPPATSQPFVTGEQVPGGGLPPWGELVERLAWHLDTDGIRTGDPIVGTNVMAMQEGIDMWLSSETFEDGSDLTDSLCVVTTKMPSFAYVESLVEKCEDVILLLGFWYDQGAGEQEFIRGDVDENGIVEIADVSACATGGPFSCNDAADVNDDGVLSLVDCIYLNDYIMGSGLEPPPPFPDCGTDPTLDELGCAHFPPCPGGGPGAWVRVGGHYVTVAGVNSDGFQIAFSDPFVDWAEFGYPGRVGSGHYIEHGYPHSATTVHNDAGNVSHDIYTVTDPSPSPGGLWSLEDYSASTDPYMWMEPFYQQNVPEEFQDLTAPWNQVSPVYTEVEYCVHISPWHYRGDVNGDGIVNVGDVVYLISYLYRAGPPPVPMSMGDVNCDGIVNLGDVVFLIGYLYRGGPVPRCCDP